MRVFGGAQIEALMSRFGMDENVPLEASLVSKAIENAQKKVEGLNFDRRKRVVEMDDVINVHRTVVYKLRKRILFGTIEGEPFKEWFIEKLRTHYPEFDQEKHWDVFEKQTSLTTFLHIIFQVSREVIDVLWMDHLTDMDNLREGIGLRGYAQKDPIIEFKNEGHNKFELLVTKIYTSIAERLTRMSIDIDSSAPRQDTSKSMFSNIAVSKEEYETGVLDEARSIKVEPVRTTPKVGRNDPCPCGSGKKYKNCHGKS
jgi:preprotein translocase subunit SecA